MVGGTSVLRAVNDSRSEKWERLHRGVASFVTMNCTFRSTILKRAWERQHVNRDAHAPSLETSTRLTHAHYAPSLVRASSCEGGGGPLYNACSTLRIPFPFLSSGVATLDFTLISYINL